MRWPRIQKSTRVAAAQWLMLAFTLAVVAVVPRVSIPQVQVSFAKAAHQTSESAGKIGRETWAWIAAISAWGDKATGVAFTVAKDVLGLVRWCCCHGCLSRSCGARCW